MSTERRCETRGRGHRRRRKPSNSRPVERGPVRSSVASEIAEDFSGCDRENRPSCGILAVTARHFAGVARSNSHPELALSNSNGVFDISSFLDLGVGAPLSQRLAHLGITDPLPIQVATIPEALSGRDICGQAPTGSGKTLAFGLPLVTNATGAKPGRPTALVLVPTRELAEQVREVLASLLGSHAKRVVALYGGTSYGPQRQALRRGADIVVACPGRLEDLVARGDVNLSQVRIVVLDEADRMVDMGFLRPVCRLVDQTAQERQILLFSATMGKEVESISRRYQHNPARYEIEAEALAGRRRHAPLLACAAHRSSDAHRPAGCATRTSLCVLPDQACSRPGGPPAGSGRGPVGSHPRRPFTAPANQSPRRLHQRTDPRPRGHRRRRTGHPCR